MRGGLFLRTQDFMFLSFCSLTGGHRHGKRLLTEGAAAIAEALKVNNTLTTLR